MSDLTVACVLRTEGGDYPGAKNTGEARYGVEHVRRLQAAVDRSLSVDHSFTCLTEWHIAGVNCRLLRHDWPGWWAKLELFRPDLFTGRVLYLDLDTSVVGSLDEIAGYGGERALIADFLRPERLATGVMLWDPSPTTEKVYTEFASMAEGAMASHRGDQDWIAGAAPWSDLRAEYPGQIVSRWEHCADGVPDGARVVCWHGEPKPDAIGWSLSGSRKHWREAVA